MLSLASKSERERFLVMVMAMMAVTVPPAALVETCRSSGEGGRNAGALLEPG